MSKSPFKQLQEEIRNLPINKREETYYSPFEVFLKSVAQDVSTASQETAAGDVGIPDITVRRKDKKVGWIEVKVPEEDLSNQKFEKQFSKYKSGLENIIFTNFRQWELWQWREGESCKVMEITCDITNPAAAAEQELHKLLERFMDFFVMEVTTAKQLALALARKTKLLSEQIEEKFDENDETAYLTQVKKEFQKALIGNISERQFANMVAETLTYSLLLAALEGEAQGDNFTLRNAIHFLPKNVPVLRSLYEIVIKTSEQVEEIKFAADLIVEQLKVKDLSGILHETDKSKPGEDAIIHFYEPFLKAYSPEERRLRGVYYTPKAVVDFIVRGTDYLLQTKFGKKDGLADEEVQILDPATGTGTFILSAIHNVSEKIKDKYANTGMVKEEFKKIVKSHILKNFYGFELMVAPYAIAHLKLVLELKRLGFDIAEADNLRLQVYLANTLDDPKTPPETLFGFEAISEEGKKASEIKKERPVLAIIGNPPYANFGKMNKQKWIRDLLKDYKKDLNEKKINLDDDYIKFIRFAQWKIANTGKGILAMITANSFLDGITHRRMRESILSTYDEVYIYNLHGNARKSETAPDGGKDENVFDIMTGVSINIFVKTEHKNDYCKVFYADAWGKRKEKFAMLGKDFAEVNWQEINYRGFDKAFLSTEWSKPLGALNFFVPTMNGEEEKITEYGNFWGVQDIFTNTNSGIQTKRDSLTIQFDSDSFQTIIKDFEELDTETIRKKYKLVADGRDWTIDWAKKDLIENKREIVDIEYRPFDIRKIIFTGETKGFVAYPRKRTMQHMLRPNLALISERTIPYQADISITCTKNIIDLHLIGGNSYIFPIYLYPDGELINKTQSNLKPEFIKTIKEKLGKTPSPEEIFYYAYAVFHCPSYRQRYAKFLKIDFPRLPITSNKKLFNKLAQLGNELVNLHLLGENPFDNSAQLFNTPNKWQIKIGGKKPSDTEDWQIKKITYCDAKNRVYVNGGQYFEGIDKATWEFMVGGYQPLDEWLKSRKKQKRCLSTDDKNHYMKIAVSLRETQKVMKKINTLIPDWQIFSE